MTALPIAKGAGIFVDAYCEDGDIGAVVMKLDEGWGFLDAGRALAPPEIQKDNLAAVAGEMDRILPVAYREVGCNSICVYRCGAAVTRSREGEHEQ